MRPSFHPRLINGPFGDPGVFIALALDSRAILVDAGDLHTLSPGDMQKIRYILISHTHMDHFIGFDQVIRSLLGREKRLQVVGPEGIIQQIGAKLAAYTWNLVENYPSALEIHVTEIRETGSKEQVFSCAGGFRTRDLPAEGPVKTRLQPAPDLFIDTAILDHHTPCLGFAIEEPRHIHIIKQGLEAMGLVPGPWLSRFKQAIHANLPPDTLIAADTGTRGEPVLMPLDALTSGIARISRGQKVAYVTDAACTKANCEKILKLAQNADHLFIEAAFSQAHSAIARKKAHLTATQAGSLAARAGVSRFTLFHFSPRYAHEPELLTAEAMAAYAAPQRRLPLPFA